jgi:phosphoesterase RecJ-like protein
MSVILPDDRFAQLMPVLNAIDSCLVIGHIDPDADCIGSMLAVTWALRQLGKRCDPVSSDPIPANCAFLPGVDEIMRAEDVDIGAYQVLVVVDCEPDRTGLALPLLEQFESVINIDHHITNMNTAPLAWVDPTAAATGELVYALISRLGLQLNRDAAVMLYTAIAGDTGFFRYSNTTARAMRIAADLIGCGVQPDVISRHLNETHSWAYMQLVRQALSTLSRTPDGKVAWIFISKDMLDVAGMQWNETDSLVQYPRMLAGIEVALILREIGPNEIRVGLRSQTYVDVSRIAGVFGGGGHQRAAGCTIRLPYQEALTALLHEIKVALASPGAVAWGD